MLYDINIIVNGNRCKQYNFEEKFFIESKKNSEYSIEIKNNTWNRILAVCSVDGLDIINGQPALEDNPGYIIENHNKGIFDGFRVSDDKIAKFVFESKSNSYAASKEKGDEKNCGVIGIRLFYEKIKLTEPIYFNQNIFGQNTHPYQSGDVVSNYSTTEVYSNNVTCLSSEQPTTNKKSVLRSVAPTFDMGTKWGASKNSKVIEVEFERGLLAFSTNIYYASRKSLIDMGIPMENENKIGFPEPFIKNKYATPPKGWNE